MMKKKPGFKLLAMVCIFAILCSCGFSVLAEDPLTPLETVPPQYASDYFLNAHFTSLKDLDNPWGGGGLAVERVTGKWSRGGGTTYDAEKQALSVQWIEATPDTPVTAPGTYVIEMDWMTNIDGISFATEDYTGDENPYILLFNYNDGSGQGGQSYFAQITDGGGLVLYGKDTGVTVQPNTWYTFRTTVSLPDGTLRAEAVERDTQTVLAQAGSQLNGIQSIKSLRTNFRRANVAGVYAQNWKFYKNDTGKVQPMDFIRPADPEGYCINVDGATMEAWSSAATGTAGTWAGASNVYEQDNGWVKLAANNQHFQANITQPALETPIGGKKAGLTEGAYVTEMDFMVELSEGSTGNIEVVTTSTVQKRDSNPEDPRTPVLVRVTADTGMITLFAGDSGTSVKTNQAAEPGTWYTAKVLMDLTNQALTVEVLERGTGAVIARGSSEMPDWLLLTTVLRSQNKAQNATLYTQNFKFYPKGEAGDVPPAVFQDAAGSELSELQPGTVSVVPTLVNTTGESMECVYIAALYEQTEQGGETLVQAKTQDYTVYENANVIWSPNEAINFEIPDDGAEYSIKCFVWDSMQDMHPITEMAELK